MMDGNISQPNTGDRFSRFREKLGFGCLIGCAVIFAFVVLAIYLIIRSFRGHGVTPFM
jgi:hypothetical protein